MKGERLAVAMSGGVDSSVAAALLIEQGYEVIGITMRIDPDETTPARPSEAGEGAGDGVVAAARQAARELGIRHHVVDLRSLFRRHVIDPFCGEYAAGRTPNPCLACNLHVKFGALLARARRLGAGRLASGHYAGVDFDEARGRWLLRRAADAAKDQSYSLYRLRQDQLARVLFPLSDITKVRTRALAAALGLSGADRPESQQICFLSDESYGQFVSRHRPEMSRPGAIVDRGGRVLGRHRGIVFYTVGQRQGLRITGDRARYVIAIDAEENRLVVGGEDELMARELVMSDVNYLAIPSLPEARGGLAAKIRSGARPAACRAEPEGRRVRLRFARAQRAITPGQAAVCYEGAAVAFGGIIDTVA